MSRCIHRGKITSNSHIYVSFAVLGVLARDNYASKSPVHESFTVTTHPYESRCIHQGQFTSNSPIYESFTATDNPYESRCTHQGQFASNSTMYEPFTATAHPYESPGTIHFELTRIRVDSLRTHPYTSQLASSSPVYESVGQGV